MRLSRTDLVPLLAIIGSGVIGFSLSSSFLLLSPSDDVPAPDPVVAPSATAEALRLAEQKALARTVLYVLEQRQRLLERYRKAVARAADLAREQRDIEANMNRIEVGQPGWEAGGRLFDRKEAMYDEIADLERELQRLKGEAQAHQQEAFGNRLGDAASMIEDDKLKERVRYSRGLIGFRDREFAREFEAETTRIVEELEEELQRASDAVEPVANSVEAIEAAPQEIRPEDAAAILAGPVFTPMTVRPEITNRNEVVQALIREYPPVLRDAGVGDTVAVWFYISETGQVLHSRVSESSGHAQLDGAALRVADVFRFTPALNRQEPVAVWIRLPITFMQ